MPRTLLDLSHVVADGVVTYPGLPAPTVSVHLSREDSRSRYAEGCEFHIGRIDMVANTGTYLDTPFHRFADGWDLASLPLERVAGVPGLLVDASGGPAAVGPEAFAGLDLGGRAVLVRTGWDRHFGTPAYGDPSHPHLTAAAAELLAAAEPALVGIDSVNIDSTAGGARPVHTTLLAAGIPIVEHLTGLDGLPPDVAFEFTAVPVKAAGLGTFPVRAYATW